VNHLNLLSNPAHAGFHEREVRTVGQAEVLQALCFGAGDISGSGSGTRVGIFMVRDKGLPVFLAGALK